MKENPLVLNFIDEFVDKKDFGGIVSRLDRHFFVLEMIPSGELKRLIQESSKGKLHIDIVRNYAA